MSLNEQRQSVCQFVRAFREIWPNSDYGPAHIAISDYNLLDHNLDFCLQRLTEVMRKMPPTQDNIEMYEKHPINELGATFRFLEILRFIPEDLRDVHAEDEEVV